MKTDNPLLMVSDGCGRLFEVPGFEAVGARLDRTVRPGAGEWIPVPEGSALMELPGRIALGFDARRRRIAPVPEYGGRPVFAAAVFSAPAHTHLYHSAFITRPDAPRLPLFAYSPLGWRDGRFWTTAVRVDEDRRHDPGVFDPVEVEKGAAAALRMHPENRLVAHLVHKCVRRYRCPNAMNFALGRWECPVPVSPACDAACLGCISEQKKSGVRSTQDRIGFTPTAAEILEFAVPHLETAERAMISFGQGCEGEPLLKAGLIEKAVRAARGLTRRGTVHLNTNAGDPDALERVAAAGLDSVRVSLNSARPEYYQKYYRSRKFGFEDMLESLGRARRAGIWISLNYFILPGFTDGVEETEAFVEIVKEFRVDCVQMRNLNIDPGWYRSALGLETGALTPGILKWRNTVKRKAPWLRFGYFNPPKEDWPASRRS